MDIEIKKLTPDLLEDYLYFFDEVAHEDCYCTCYSSDQQGEIDFRSKDVRRKYAIQYIKEGKIQGYLAYQKNHVVGWCNANDKVKCFECEGWTTMLPDVSKNDSSNKGAKVKSIFCFTISPDMRRQGIATRLLEYVIHDAAKEGYTYIESYPYKEFINIFYDHMGPIGLYKKLEFTPYEKLGKRIVMRKYLQ